MTYASGALHRFGHALQVISSAAIDACLCSGGISRPACPCNRLYQRRIVSGPFLGRSAHKSFSQSVANTSDVDFSIVSSPRKQFANCSRGLQRATATLRKIYSRKGYGSPPHSGQAA